VRAAPWLAVDQKAGRHVFGNRKRNDLYAACGARATVGKARGVPRSWSPPCQCR
jgi:hypothetical protein